jgi:hypothetical protein
MTLPPFRRPDEFLGDFRDEAGLSPDHLGCLLHCMRDVLRGHGIAHTVRYIVRPLQVVLSVDPRFRPWLCSAAEEELTCPAFEAGLQATYRWASDIPALCEAVDAMLDAGKPAIVFANRWLVPWQPQSPLAQSEGHASVVVAREGNGLLLVDRQPAGNTTQSRDVHCAAEELSPSIKYGIAVLDYDLAEPGLTPAEQVRSLIRRSAANLAAAPPQPQLRSRGLDALNTLRLLFSEEVFPRLDSPHLRLSMRWHLGSCIHKYVIGSRVLLRAYVALDGADIPELPQLIEALEASVTAWDMLARSFAYAGRHGLVSRAADLPKAIQAAEQADTRLVGALREAG